MEDMPKVTCRDMLELELEPKPVSQGPLPSASGCAPLPHWHMTLTHSCPDVTEEGIIHASAFLPIPG